MSDTTVNKSMMKVEDVSKRLNVSDSFVYDAINTGRLKHHRLGRGQGGIRVSEEQLAAYLRDTERGGTQEAPAPKPVTPPPSQHLKL
jgi:excisionase family DNA binding protein